jgi:hypothetical protein
MSSYSSDSSSKYSTIFGIGMGLIAIGYPPIANMIYGIMGGALLTIIFLLLAIFMVWMFWLKMLEGIRGGGGGGGGSTPPTPPNVRYNIIGKVRVEFYHASTLVHQDNYDGLPINLSGATASGNETSSGGGNFRFNNIHSENINLSVTPNSSMTHLGNSFPLSEVIYNKVHVGNSYSFFLSSNETIEIVLKYKLAGSKHKLTGNVKAEFYDASGNIVATKDYDNLSLKINGISISNNTNSDASGNYVFIDLLKEKYNLAVNPDSKRKSDPTSSVEYDLEKVVFKHNSSNVEKTTFPSIFSFDLNGDEVVDILVKYKIGSSKIRLFGKIIGKVNVGGTPTNIVLEKAGMILIESGGSKPKGFAIKNVEDYEFKDLIDGDKSLKIVVPKTIKHSGIDYDFEKIDFVSVSGIPLSNLVNVVNFKMYKDEEINIAVHYKPSGGSGLTLKGEINVSCTSKGTTTLYHGKKMDVFLINSSGSSVNSPADVNGKFEFTNVAPGNDYVLVLNYHGWEHKSMFGAVDFKIDGSKIKITDLLFYSNVTSSPITSLIPIPSHPLFGLKFNITANEDLKIGIKYDDTANKFNVKGIVKARKKDLAGNIFDEPVLSGVKLTFEDKLKSTKNNVTTNSFGEYAITLDEDKYAFTVGNKNIINFTKKGVSFYDSSSTLLSSSNPYDFDLNKYEIINIIIDYEEKKIGGGGGGSKGGKTYNIYIINSFNNNVNSLFDVLNNILGKGGSP